MGLKKLREDPMVKGLPPMEAYGMLRNPLKTQVIPSMSERTMRPT